MKNFRREAKREIFGTCKPVLCKFRNMDCDERPTPYLAPISPNFNFLFDTHRRKEARGWCRTCIEEEV
ncbi:hypothetical protein TcasGA2_TC009062 [Tribolium castaneum]|uniref:Uncharacterized protein n=1 Tax=Tribolium castaneum TaxID=7070 RepID=D6WPJ2_TRICA|nr:hypothetical protein TcasGA2_TC009062 [Tribolium castaneum]